MADAQTLTISDDPLSAMQGVRSQFNRARAEVKVTAAAEATNARRITLQVIDRLKKTFPGRWLIDVFVTGSSGGNPSATGNTVSWVTGFPLTVTANAWYRVITDSTGLAVFDLTISGAATRYVCSTIGGEFKESEPLAWT